MALLKMLALGQRQIDEGKIQPVGDVVGKLRNRSYVMVIANVPHSGFECKTISR
ncbi:hypothetical protein [Marinomonas hwangdonensis]|uniref:hypothetical protein n=1 Tax=Marinomonas hwangdonensis TaxID=1053647 RepID=UPI001F4E7C6C|nr:hypothetical protein [Marinomonas hwangdonensis]